MRETDQEKAAVQKHEISLKAVLVKIQIWYIYLLSKKKIIFLSGLLGVLSGLLLSFIYKPRYIANTTFVLENSKKSGLGDYASIAARFGFSASSSGGLFQEDNNIITFMKSRTMIAQTLYSEAPFENGNLLLAERYLESNNYRKKWAKEKQLASLRFHTNSSERTILEDSVISFLCKDILKKNLNVDKPDREEDVIKVTTVTPDELFSKTFNEKLLEKVTDFYIASQTKKSQENVNILEHQVDSIRGLLNSALSGVAVYSEANPNPNPALQRLKVPSQKKMVDVEMNKAILEELVKNLEISKVTLRKETPLVQIIDSPVLPLEEKKIGVLKGMVLGGVVFFMATLIFLSLRLYLSLLLKEG